MLRFEYTNAETNLLFDALAELQETLEARREKLLDADHMETSPRVVAVKAKLAEVERLVAKLGNDLSGYTVEESEASLQNL